MKEVAPGVALRWYRVVQFHFDLTENLTKSGWDVYPEIKVHPRLGGGYEGNLRLYLNFFGERGNGFVIRLVAEAQFWGENIEEEKFGTLCRSQGAALLVQPLRQLVNDFLARVL